MTRVRTTTGVDGDDGSLDLEGADRVVNLLGRGDGEIDLDDGAAELALEPYACRWFRVGDVQSA